MGIKHKGVNRKREDWQTCLLWQQICYHLPQKAKEELAKILTRAKLRLATIAVKVGSNALWMG